MSESHLTLFQAVITALITLSVLGVMGYGAVTGTDVGAFSDYGAIVIGYYFGARAQGAVAKVATPDGRVPSVL